jgi:hypothetical protein
VPALDELDGRQVLLLSAHPQRHVGQLGAQRRPFGHGADRRLTRCAVRRCASWRRAGDVPRVCHRAYGGRLRLSAWFTGHFPCGPVARRGWVTSLRPNVFRIPTANRSALCRARCEEGLRNRWLQFSCWKSGSLVSRCVPGEGGCEKGRTAIFRQGSHLCVGKDLSQWVCRTLVYELAKIPLHVRITEARLRSHDFAFNMYDSIEVSMMKVSGQGAPKSSGR